tara:strand:+ start:3272 stop:6235 length:2964 start_codon:yes stop_codon:yes gene_type:complete
MSVYSLDDVRQTQAYLLSEVDKNIPIFRINKRDGSGVHNHVLAPVVVTSTSSPSITTKITSPWGGFIDLPDELLICLTPEIEVYKTFIDKASGKEYNYLLPMGRYLALTPRGKQVVQGIVVKSAEFTRLGGNPAEIDTNIKFNIKIFGEEISSFFAKNTVAPEENFTGLQDLHDAVNISEAMEENAARVAALTAKRWLGGTISLTDEEKLFLRVQSSNTVSPLDVGARAAELQTRLDALNASLQLVGPNGERKVAWIDLIKIDPGQPLNAVRDNALLTSEHEVRIKVELGYAKVDEAPEEFKGTDAEWLHWKGVIERQRETFYLSLFKHQFTFDGYSGVSLSIDFIATGNAKTLTPEADLFHDSHAEGAIEHMEASISLLEEDLDAASTDEGMNDEVRESCVNRLTTEIDENKKIIQDYRSSVKMKILNQLYLDKANSKDANGKQRWSRVFVRTFKRPTDDSEEGREKTAWKVQSSSEYHYINNMTVPVRNNLQDAEVQLSAGSIEQIDLNAADEEGEIGITREHYEEGRAGDFFVYLGDIIESALETLVPGDTELRTVTNLSTRLSYGDTLLTRQFAWTTSAALYLKNLTNGGTQRSQSSHDFRPPFCWRSSNSPASAEVQRKRLNAALSQFGGILTGTVSYTDPNRTKSGIIKTVRIRDIPIALDIFRSWWINTYVKSGKKTLYFRDFVVALMRFVEKEVFKETPLNFGRVEERVDDPRFIVNSILVDTRTFNNGMYRSMGNVFRNILPGDIRPPYPGSTDKAFHTMVIEHTPDNPPKSGDVPNIVFGVTAEGILKKINFQREDIPGHAEARLFSDRTSTASNLALREKYNTSLELIGTVCFQPGGLVYLDPLPLDIGYAEEKDSLARSLGLGGMYRVVNITSVLSFDASGQEWNTKVNTKWVSFGDGGNGSTAVTTPSPSALGVCQEEIDAEELRLNPFPETPEQFLQRQAEEQSSAFYVDPAEGQRAEDVVPLGVTPIMAPAD